MADKKIGEVTHDDSIGGSEKLPMDDAGTAKYATTGDLKNYILAQIAALQEAGSVDVDADGVYLLKGGALKPVDADVLASAVLDYGFGKVAVASMNGNEVVGVKDAASQKTITLAQLKTWLQENMTVTTDIDISAKDAAGALAGENLLVIAQSGTNKKLTIATMASYVHTAFKDYVSSLTAVTNLVDGDMLYVVNGSTAKKCTVSQMKTLIGAGDVTGPDSTTNNNVPQWDAQTKKLKDGLSVQGTVRASGTASATAIPTEAAVRAAIQEVQSPVSSVNAKTGAVVLSGSDIPVSGSDATKIDAKLASLASMNTDFVGATSSSPGVHGLVPAPSIANRNKFLKADGTWADVPADVIGPETTTENKIPQWDTQNKKLKDGLSAVATVRPLTATSPATPADDTSVPTEKAVRTAVDDIANEILQVVPYVGGAFTKGQIPIISDGSQTGFPNVIISGKSVVTSIGASPSDNNIPTEAAVATSLATKPTATLATSVNAQSTDAQVPSAKAVNDFVSAKVPYAKLAEVDLTGGTSSATIQDHAVNRFVVATGGTYTLTLPTAQTGLARDFYVVFKQSGTQGATSTVTFSAQVHTSRNGTDSNITLTKDVAGASNAFHVYHIHEDASELWCVNEFETVDANGGGYVKYQTVAIPTPAEGVSASVSVQNKGVHCFSVSSAMDLTVNVPARESNNPIDLYFGIVGTVQGNVFEVHTTFSSSDSASFVDKSGFARTSANPFVLEAGTNRSSFVHLFEIGGKIVVDILEEMPTCDDSCSYQAFEMSISTGSEGSEEIILSAKAAAYVTFDGTVTDSVPLHPYSEITPLMEEGYDSVRDAYIIGTNNGTGTPNIVVDSSVTTVSQILLPVGISSIGALFESGKIVKVKCSMRFNANCECTALMFSKECECAIPQPSAS